MHYVISDIHGNIRRFHSILEQINLQPEDHLYVLGDISDRHPHGMEILQELMEMPNCSILLGNHEYMMLHALGRPYRDPSELAGRKPADFLSHWYRNGGEVTHSAWRSLPEEKQEEIVAFLLSLPISIDVEVNGHHFEMVHAAPPELYQPDSVVWKDLPYFAVWNRDALLQAPPPEDRLILFGHTPTNHFQDCNPLCVWEGPNLLGIDCGSGFPDPPVPGRPHGRLSCVRLEDMQIWYSEEQPLPEPPPEPDPPPAKKAHWYDGILNRLSRKKS